MNKDGYITVSVPLRGIGSEKRTLLYSLITWFYLLIVSVPLRGIGSEKHAKGELLEESTIGFRPLAGNRF